jgi:hypothetical protein
MRETISILLFIAICLVLGAANDSVGFFIGSIIGMVFGAVNNHK